MHHICIWQLQNFGKIFSEKKECTADFDLDPKGGVSQLACLPVFVRAVQHAIYYE
jgi:hypothetical protein